ncbi:hypothetical protein ACWDYH_33295 [Nocardia goodfellowii]|uniref:Arc/MetJ-type ribon-helix-helix transcriptional regulator n=1 Tax=Nocardia goodfellowii TaxID=882446 RepID=A0ABS4QHX3_9NOCA|nr:hypothetical protein [Nocardia goodfellowii]MBP2190760.1 Arc/MetJ-type ribon-helix-helix transcriptional regulator [Nocardia goodfellowii]
MTAERKTRKVTITLPEEIAATLDLWRARGQISSVSAYVADSVKARMDRAELDRVEALAKVEEVIGGPPPLEMINRARAMQGLPPLSQKEFDERRPGAA